MQKLSQLPIYQRFGNHCGKSRFIWLGIDQAVNIFLGKSKEPSYAIPLPRKGLLHKPTNK